MKIQISLYLNKAIYAVSIGTSIKEKPIYILYR